MKKFSVTVLLSLTLLNPQGFCADEATSEARFESRKPTPSPLAVGLDLQFLPARFPNYLWAQGVQSNRMGMGFRMAWEWLPLANRYGKAGVGAGAGYVRINQVAVGTNTSWLEAFPLDAYATYRFDYVDDQAVVPFLKLGYERQYARQFATDGTHRYNGFNFSAGIAFLLDRLDRYSAAQLDTSTGINNTYLTFEYLNSKQVNSPNEINLAREELRLGLRFEM